MNDFNPLCGCGVRMNLVKPHNDHFNALYGCERCDVAYFVSDDEGPITVSLVEYLEFYPVESIAA